MDSNMKIILMLITMIYEILKVFCVCFMSFLVTSIKVSGTIEVPSLFISQPSFPQVTMY